MNSVFAETARVFSTDLCPPPHWRGEEIGQPDSRARPCVWRVGSRWAWGYETDCGQSLVEERVDIELDYAINMANAVTRASCLVDRSPTMLLIQPIIERLKGQAKSAEVELVRKTSKSTQNAWKLDVSRNVKELKAALYATYGPVPGYDSRTKRVGHQLHDAVHADEDKWRRLAEGALADLHGLEGVLNESSTGNG